MHVEGLTQYIYSSQYVLNRVLFCKYLYSEGWLQALLRLCCSIRAQLNSYVVRPGWCRASSQMVEHILPIFWGIPTSTPTASWKRCHRAAASREYDILAAMDEILTPLHDVAFLNFPVARVLMGAFARSQQGSNAICL